MNFRFPERSFGVVGQTPPRNPNLGGFYFVCLFFRGGQLDNYFPLALTLDGSCLLYKLAQSYFTRSSSREVSIRVPFFL